MLYHVELGFPKSIKKISGMFLLDYTEHAIKASKNDRYGDIILPKHIDIKKATLIEMEVIDNVMVKGVYRIEYNELYDLVLVITNFRVVKTVWLNSKEDKHATLDESKYIKIRRK